MSFGFSLMEVVIASAIFAGTITLGVALLAGLVRESGELESRLVARRLPDAVKLELDRLASGGFDALAARVPTLAGPATDGFKLVAAADGSDVQALEYRPPVSGRLPLSAQFFIVELWRYPGEPLRYDPAKASLAMHVRVSWPFHLPGNPSPVPPAERRDLSFAITLSR